MGEKSKRYEKLKHLGEGQFANVYKAKDLETGDIVAIKKIKLGSRTEARDGVNRTALREIKLLQELHHDNIIGLRDVLGSRNTIQLVFDFMETDLENIVKDKSIILNPPQIKNMALQTFLGLEFLHEQWVLHRDLKPNNLLMNASGRIKLADFGLARFFGSPNRNYTHQVVTRWYRAPELIFGAKSYGVGIDNWAMGCIIAELLLRNPIFPGETDIHQWTKICEVLGTPKEDEWPKITSFSDYFVLVPQQGFDLHQVFTAAGEDLIEMMQGLFTFDPLKRWTATQSLKSAYFRNDPPCCPDDELPLPGRPQTFGQSRRRKHGEFEDYNEPARKRLIFD